jgi:glycosyltransferase involved in cell wall biosynthesis
MIPNDPVQEISATASPQASSASAAPPDTPGISIVVPCYNEEQGIEELIRRCCESAQAVVGASFELILVDDGSTDATWERISDQLQKRPQLVAIRLSRNHGHQLALTAGLSAVNGSAVFVLDADLQDPPELLQDFVNTMRASSADVVYGQRLSRSGEGWFKSVTAHLFYRTLAQATKISIPVDTGDFRLMSRRVSDLIVRMPERDRFLRGMIAWVGFRQVAFPYHRQDRFAGTTKYSFSKMVAFAVDAFLGYSMLLLRFSAILAFFLLIVLIGVAAYTLRGWLFLDAVPGWTSTVLLIVSVSMFQLVVLSIIGEYVGRIYLSTKDRPLFIVDEVKRGKERLMAD